MVQIKTEQELGIMREACVVAATVLDRVCQDVVPGISTYELDQLAKKYMDELGAESACYNYRVGANTYPGYICISINEEIVHGIGRLDRVIQPDDCVSLDVVTRYKGFIGDNARTVCLSDAGEEVRDMVEATKQALDYALNYAQPGKRVGDISNAVQRFIEKQNYGIVRDFVGHGVGRSMHEEPQIPNFGRRKTGPILRAGMTLAIEPMVTLKDPDVEILNDGWTAITRDRAPSAHFEQTVLICKDGPEILTIPKN